MGASTATGSGKILSPYPAYLLLVATYIASGKLGLMLALPPGYASAIFPPAGIAIAAALISGRHVLPWVFLASLLLNVWTGYSVNYGIDGIDFAAATIIATASMLQAAVGGTWLRRAIGYPVSVDNGSELLRFFFAAPLICLTSASLSVLGLWAIGVIGAQQIVVSWGTWWIGDTLGALVMFPLVLVAAGEPRALWRRRASTVALPMTLVFVFFVFAFVKVSKWEHDDSLMEFRLTSQHLANQIQAKFDEQAALLEQMDGLFQVNPRVTREQFHLFARKPLLRFPMIQALEWAPHIDQAQRTGFEAVQRKDIPGFEIRDRDATGKLRREEERSQYYPVAYVEPLAGNELVRGFDLASGPRRNTALHKSIETGSVIATAPVGLVQKKGQHGMLLLLAVRDGSAGVGVVVLGMQDFMDKLLANPAHSMYVRFEDIDEQQRLYDSFPAGIADAAYEQRIEFGSRHYRLQTVPMPAYLAQHQGWQSWGVLVLGLFGTSLLGGLLLLGTGHTARVEAEVVERTRKLKESETQLKVAQHMAKIGSWELDLVRDILLWSDEIYRIFELDPQRFGASYKTFLGMVHPEDRAQVDRAYQDSVKNRTAYDIEHRLLLPDGRIKFVHEQGETFYNQEGRPVQSIGTVQDITERKQAEAAVRKVAAEMEDLYNRAPCGYHSLDRDGVMLRVNDTELQWLGYDRKELIGTMKFIDLLTPASQQVFQDNFAKFKDQGFVNDLEFELIRKDGTTFTVLLNATAIYDASGHYQMSRSTMFDITERKHNQEQIRQLAYYDFLTELPNRRLLLDRMHQALSQARHYGRSMAIMFLDLDHFKQINDSLGHDVGDELLKTVATRLTTCIRSGDTVSRQGGDEFVIVLAEIAHAQDAALVAEKAIAALNEPVVVRGHKLNVTTSIGIAVYPIHGTDDVLELMKKADKAMYIAKESGRNRYSFFPFE